MKTKIYLLPVLFGLLFGSCKDYLNVGSDTELTQDQMFANDEGFHKALTGVYIGLGSSDLYGSQLTWRMVEHFAHHYTLKSGMDDQNFFSHSYTQSNVSGTIANVWNGMYNLIANCNNILQNLEKKKDDIHPVNYQLVKGEALALRAFLHFDLLRLFGHGNYRNRSAELSNRLTIPYVTTFNKEITPQATYSQVFEYLKKDLNEAIDLLWGENGENCSMTYTSDDESAAYFGPAEGTSSYFYTITDYDTKPRINYFGAKAILARVLMWEGTDEGYQQILDFLEDEWIPAGDDDGMDCWDWMSNSRWTRAYVDRLMTQENIWQLSVSGLYDIVGQWFVLNKNTDRYNEFGLTKARFQEIFEYNTGNNSGLQDVRRSTLYLAKSSSYQILKLDQYEGENNYTYKNIIPLITTPELYYMAAEIYMEKGNLPKALEYLNTVRQKRKITTDLEGLDAVQVKEEIIKEWRKEYIALGQLFFLYKRLGLDVVFETEMTDEQYVLPFPDAEIINGNREQDI